MVVEVTRAVLEQLVSEAKAAQPCECCGILTGMGSHIDGTIPARNIHPNPETHFEIDPQALVDAHRAARAGGPDILGYYHSHPSGPAKPSMTDSAQASGDGRIWAIIADGEIALWRDAPDGFEALSYVVTER